MSNPWSPGRQRRTRRSTACRYAAARSGWFVCSCVIAIGILMLAGMAAASESAAPLSHPADASSSMMCGPECLWLAARLHGKDVSLDRMAEIARTDPYLGTTVANMIVALEKIGLYGELVTTDLDSLGRDSKRAILIVDMDSHYVFFERADSREVRFVSSAERKSMPRAEFSRYWGGLAIIVGDSPPPPRWWLLWTTTVAVVTIAGVIFHRKGRKPHCPAGEERLSVNLGGGLGGN